MLTEDYNSVHQAARTAARPDKDEAPSMRVLLVEDDPLLGEALQAGLHQHGFAVDWVRDGMAGLAAMTSDRFDAVVLDLGLPRLDGRRLLERRRGEGDRTPVLVLTARDTIEDRVTGLDAGADDYVVKPVAISELAARLRALVRRASGLARAEVSAGPLSIDPSSRAVTWHGQTIDLAPREYDILLSLALKAGRVLTREQLVSALYEWDESIESNAIEVHVHHLRRKLSPELIRTVRGVGYMMMSDGGTPAHA